jgi:hypothetical protein
MASNCTLDLISPWISAKAPLTRTRKGASYLHDKYTPVAHTRFPSCSLSSLKYEVMRNPARPVLQSCGTAAIVDGITTTGLACVRRERPIKAYYNLPVWRTISVEVYHATSFQRKRRHHALQSTK